MFSRWNEQSKNGQTVAIKRYTRSARLQITAGWMWNLNDVQMALTLKMWENSRKCVMLLSWQPNANWKYILWMKECANQLALQQQIFISFRVISFYWEWRMIQETAGIGVSTFQIGKMDYSPFKNFLLPLTYLGKKKTWIALKILLWHKISNHEIIPHEKHFKIIDMNTVFSC